MKFQLSFLLLAAPAASLYMLHNPRITASTIPRTAYSPCPANITTPANATFPLTSNILANRSVLPFSTNESLAPVLLCPASGTTTWNPSVDTIFAIFFGVVAAALQLKHIRVTRHVFQRKSAGHEGTEAHRVSSHQDV